MWSKQQKIELLILRSYFKNLIKLAIVAFLSIKLGMGVGGGGLSTYRKLVLLRVIKPVLRLLFFERRMEAIGTATGYLALLKVEKHFSLIRATKMVYSQDHKSCLLPGNTVHDMKGSSSPKGTRGYATPHHRVKCY